MLGHFNDLLHVAGNEGASSTIDFPMACTRGDCDQLLNAWYHERQERVEVGLFLTEACQLLSAILGEGQVSTTSRRKARSLLRAIEEQTESMG